VHAAGSENTELVAVSADWLRLARIARILSWLTLAWMGIEGGVAIVAAVLAGSVALLGFGLDSGIEAMASIIVIWRFTGTRLASATSQRRAQQLVAVSFFLLAPYIAVEAVRALVAGDRAATSIAGLILTAGTAIFEPALWVAKRRIGARLGSMATAGEGTQNLLGAYLAVAVFAGLAANTLLGAWWLDGVVALGIAAWAMVEGRRAWAGKSCGCASQPGTPPGSSHWPSRPSQPGQSPWPHAGHLDRPGEAIDHPGVGAPPPEASSR
jgi:divalent metal cation (Fe/Co/Zn/Cd) transporter